MTTGELTAGVPERDYHAPMIGRASVSALRQVLRSPAHYRAWLDSPQEPTAAMRFGRAAHCAILEPDAFESRFAVTPDVDRRTSAGKAAWAQWCEAHPTHESLSADDLSRVVKMGAAVERHPTAAALLRGATEREATVRWSDPDYGLPCQARFDGLDIVRGIVVDIKTTTDASPEAFARSCATFGYHLQAAWYLRAAAAAGYPAAQFALICVETTAPHAVAVYTLDREAIDAGDRMANRGIARLSDCLRTDTWPGYSPEPQELHLPPWSIV